MPQTSATAFQFKVGVACSTVQSFSERGGCDWMREIQLHYFYLERSQWFNSAVRKIVFNAKTNGVRSGSLTVDSWSGFGGFHLFPGHSFFATIRPKLLRILNDFFRWGYFFRSGFVRSSRWYSWSYLMVIGSCSPLLIPFMVLFLSITYFCSLLHHSRRLFSVKWYFFLIF